MFYAFLNEEILLFSSLFSVCLLRCQQRTLRGDFRRQGHVLLRKLLDSIKYFTWSFRITDDSLRFKVTTGELRPHKILSLFSTFFQKHSRRHLFLTRPLIQLLFLLLRSASAPSRQRRKLNNFTNGKRDKCFHIRRCDSQGISLPDKKYWKFMLKISIREEEVATAFWTFTSLILLQHA